MVFFSDTVLVCVSCFFFSFFFVFGFGNCTSPAGTQITVDFKLVEDLKKLILIRRGRSVGISPSEVRKISTLGGKKKIPK